MPRHVLLDELHLTFSAPASVAPDRRDRLAALLAGRHFTARLRRAVLGTLRRHRSLRGVQVTLSR